MLSVDILLGLVLAYLACGLAFAPAFVTVGVGRIDAAARHTSPAFRALLLPGAVALWPVLARKWWGAKS